MPEPPRGNKARQTRVFSALARICSHRSSFLDRSHPMFRSSSKLAVLAVVASAFLANPALAVDTVTAKDAPDLASVRAKIKTKDWPNAVAELQTVAATHQHADVYNLLGFSLRNLGDYTQARTFYTKALEFDPDHRGAHEYLGE